MDEKTTQFLPFHAINEFMREDYRQTVIRSTLNALSILPKESRDPVDKLTRKYVQISGFRISTKAPGSLRLKPTVEAFTKHPEMVGTVMSAWAQLNNDLRSQVYDLLVSRGWEILPVEADRTKLPGFIPVWPEGEDFDKLGQAFKDRYPSLATNDDDVSLMIVWLSGRLPYQSPVEEP